MNDREMNSFWKKIVNTINDGLMFIGPEGSILMVNKAFETLTGYASQDAIGMPCTMLGCETCEKYMKSGKAWCKLFEPGQEEMKKCRCLVKCRDGSYLPVLKNAAMLRDENNTVLGVVETLTDISELTRLDEKLNILSRQYDAENDFMGIVGRSQVMISVFNMIRKAAESQAPVIILGESGTGKELVANAIHMCGARKKGPFIQLNCASLNASVLESELFGHAKGAFTGAYSNRIGRFEAANHGDLFLDEIGDIPLPLQTKLLRVLESGQFERVGDISPISVDVRIISATNKNLDDLIAKDLFRQDLFFRINVIPILLPPLRDRKEDIPLLVNTFIQRLNQKTGKSVQGIDNAAMTLFMKYHWPGNIRELKNAMEYAFVVAEADFIRLTDLPKNICPSESWELSGTVSRTGTMPGSNEKSALIQALKQTGGNQTKAAALLGVTRVTVWHRMKKYGIDLKKQIQP